MSYFDRSGHNYDEFGHILTDLVTLLPVVEVATGGGGGGGILAGKSSELIGSAAT